MGIKEYSKYITYEFPHAKSRDYDYVYFDGNYLLHYLIYKCNSDIDLYKKVYNFWDYLISIIKIKKSLYLVFDGEYETDAITNPKLQTHLIRSKAKIKSDNYDKQSIYPGSLIIKTFKDFLLDIIEKYKKINKLNFTIEINSDNNKGEADIKILNLIYNSNQDNICICSKDSDMILISYSIVSNKSIHIDILSDFRPIKFVNINKLSNFGIDYLLIVLFLGNDYLPKISNVSYDIIINTYNKYIQFNKPIISNNEIQLDNLINYVSMIICSSNKKIKFKFNLIDINRFKIYYNNLNWCLKYYKVINNDTNYISELKNVNDDIKIKNVINIFNFINFYK